MMKLPKRPNDAVHWYMSGITSRIVAESGRPDDRFHLGKILFQSFKDVPDFLMQIDGATGESETSGSALERTVRCANALRNIGLECGDVIVLMAPSHIDLAIPFYAAFYLGVIAAAVDRTLGVEELRDTFAVNRPKIVFCQSEKAPDIQLALNELELDTRIVTFDKGEFLCSFSEFLDEFDDGTSVDDFKFNDFDPEEAIALLIATSGTTGLPKAAAITHKNFAINGPYLWSRCTNFPSPTRMALVVAPLQWLTALMNFILSPIMRYTRLQTSTASTQEHTYDLINTYKEMSPDTEVVNCYGMSELCTIGFHGAGSAPPGSCGSLMGCFQYRLVDTETLEDIVEPNVPGELLIKGPGIFKGYYNNSKATEETFAEDRWFKTGDTFYRDASWNYYFVERIKLLLKYKSYQISPVEVENVIRHHPGVLDVAVTGIPDPESGDLPVACVVRRPESDVTAQDIKDLVKGTLSDSKQLRGGVIFMDAIPMTASTKVHRRKLKELALVMDKE
ncbi:luciferin 4-monooxygenase-like isoform X2 [Ostrinia furnacalis]|uniref:luciferin 4-monooxygenase-like isoform X2 n=1 Tax=Ostrinia furnacalis TaxID=93504 RepID=UPI00103FE152|nr:luciferin 4-monooxygenase-like isoform X2 [Ostrinia furnacalis]